METVIRSAQLARARTRLSEAGQSTPPVADAAASALAAARKEIEAQVRSEMAAHAQQLYESELARAQEDALVLAEAEAQAAAERDIASIRHAVEAEAREALEAMRIAQVAALAKLEASVGEVAFAAVCRLIGARATSQSFVLALVEQVCAQMPAESAVTARLHPRDIKILSDRLRGTELFVGSSILKLIPDESLSLGGCVIDTASGQYDGGLESQLRRLHAVLSAESISSAQEQPCIG